jgi:hypothetical protein
MKTTYPRKRRLLWVLMSFGPFLPLRSFVQDASVTRRGANLTLIPGFGEWFDGHLTGTIENTFRPLGGFNVGRT